MESQRIGHDLVNQQQQTYTKKKKKKKKKVK